ncbi:hypothetical protein N1F89_19795 [Aquibium sp. A9E412]|nr:hypothetical protein [Aquibium sp. A9E412]MDN2568474.1 hypothetical protein [Aquibium sp. A9E412]
MVERIDGRRARLAAGFDRGEAQRPAWQASFVAVRSAPNAATG